MIRCSKCNEPADILVHNKYFCMKHYSDYYYKQSSALLPFQFITNQEPEPEQETEQELNWEI